MKMDKINRIFLYFIVWAVFSVLMLYAIKIYFNFIYDFMIKGGPFEQYTPFFLLTLVVAYFFASITCIVYLVKRFRGEFYDETYPIININDVDGTTGYMYTSNGVTVLETNIVTFEISSPEALEVWNGSKFVDANIQDLNVTKEQKVYARLKRNNDPGGDSYSAQTSISSISSNS